MRRRLALLLAVAFVGVTSGCGGSKSWSCNWNCNSNGSSGSHTYPDGPDPTSQCTADFGASCNDFSCSCSQG